MKIKKENFLNQDDGRERDAMLFEAIEELSTAIEELSNQLLPLVSIRRIVLWGSGPAIIFTAFCFSIFYPDTLISKVFVACLRLFLQ